MSLRLNERYPQIESFLKTDRKQKITDLIRINLTFNGLGEDTYSESHFRCFWDTLISLLPHKVANSKEIFQTLFLLSQICPKYSESNLDLFRDDRFPILVNRLLEYPEYADIVFHSLVQILINQTPEVAEEFASRIFAIIDGSELPKEMAILNSTICTIASIQQTGNVYDILKVLGTLEQYITHRVAAKAQSGTYLSRGFDPQVFMNLVTYLTRILTKSREELNVRSLITILSYELLIFYCMDIDELPCVSYQNLAPFSVLAQASIINQNINMFVMYRPLFLRVLEVVMHFSRSYTHLSETAVTDFIRMYEAVTSGPAGRDAVIVTIVYCNNHPVFSRYMTNLLTFVYTNTRTKIHNILSVSLITSFDCDYFPSIAVIMYKNTSASSIIKLLESVSNNYGDSPLGRKAAHVHKQFTEQGHGETMYDDAVIMAHKLWMRKSISTPPTYIIRYCMENIARSECLIIGMQIIIAFMWRKEHVELVTSDGFFLDTLYAFVGASYAACSVLPKWHILRLWNESMLTGIVNGTSISILIMSLLGSCTPACRFGATVIVMWYAKINPESVALWIGLDPKMLGSMCWNAALSELKVYTCLMCEFFSVLRVTRVCIIEHIYNRVLLCTETRGWRAAVRIAAPLLQSEMFIDFLYNKNLISEYMTALLALTRLPSSTEMSESKSWVLIWKSIGCHPYASDVGVLLTEMIKFSGAMTYSTPEKEQFFYDALYDVVMSVSSFYICKFPVPILRLDDYLIAFVMRLPQPAAERYRNENLSSAMGPIEPHEVKSPKVRFPVVWAPEDWAPEVTGVAYHY